MSLSLLELQVKKDRLPKKSTQKKRALKKVSRAQWEVLILNYFL